MSVLQITYIDKYKFKNHMAGVVKIGYLKKKKSMRKKFFVLREDTINGPSHLEYHESEKKWKNNDLPKRVIVLKSCFNIEKRENGEIKKPFISLYTEEKYYSIQFDSDNELEEWLGLMVTLQRSNPINFELYEKSPEHIWHIIIEKKELGLHQHLKGLNGLCLYEKKVSTSKHSSKSKEHKSVDIKLSSIRRCGVLGSLFYLEVGQSSPLGAGHLWMDTQSKDTATSIHNAIMNSSSSRNVDPRFRTRSSSVNHESHLINCPHRQGSNMCGSVRERCDSMPVRPFTINENTTSSNQTFYKNSNCSHASSTLFGYNKCNSKNWNESLPKSSDITDGVSSFYSSRNDNQSVIYEENHEDLVSYIPIDKREDSLRQTSDSNVNNYVNWIKNNTSGNKSSSSSQASSCYDSNSPCYSPMNVDDTCTPLNPPGAFEALSTPDGYVPMKPVCPKSYIMSKDKLFNSKQESTEMAQTEIESSDDYVPMTSPSSRISDYVPMYGKRKSFESGTPSTDPRFSNIRLDKVCAYISPPERNVHIELPVRANSVGSRPDGLREQIDKVNQTRARAFSVGSQSQLPPTGLPTNINQSKSTSMSEHNDCGDHMEIDFSCNSKARRDYSATCRTLSIHQPTNTPSRSSPKSCSSLDPSCTHRPTGCSPNALVSSGTVNSNFKSPPLSSNTLEKVSEVPSVELVDSCKPMKLAQRLFSCDNSNMLVEESSKKKNVRVKEATKSPSQIMKFIGGLNWKKKKNTTPVPK